MFVVDRSGSMNGDNFTNALAAVRRTIEAPTDDLEIAVVAFNDAAIRWPGRPGGKVPQGWASLPSSETPKAAMAWLRGLGSGGDTLVIPALKAAFADQRPNMTIVIVSDGLFGRERTTDVLAAIAAWQAARESKAVIAVYGVGDKAEVLCEIARVGLGGYFREVEADGAR